MQMQKTKLFMNGRSQAERLPKECQFDGRDVCIQKYGDIVILVPTNQMWETFLHGLNSFTDDFLCEKREQGASEERDTF